ncbi:MAG: hypothetical protein EAX96_07290 [Candidatus Lokiarchaeota archaeon]|nr:hypothetical protein [Candidatus Lokiarchaeota archaeon]
MFKKIIMMDCNNQLFELIFQMSQRGLKILKTRKRNLMKMFIFGLIFIMSFSFILGALFTKNPIFTLISTENEDDESYEDITIPNQEEIKSEDPINLESKNIETEIVYSGDAGSSLIMSNEYAKNTSTKNGINMKGGTTQLTVPYGWNAGKCYTNVTNILEIENWVRDMNVEQSMSTGWYYYDGNQNPGETQAPYYTLDDISGEIDSERLKISFNGINDGTVSNYEQNFNFTDHNGNDIYEWEEFGDGTEEWSSSTSGYLDGNNAYGYNDVLETDEEYAWRQTINYASHADDIQVQAVYIGYALRAYGTHDDSWGASGYLSVSAWIDFAGRTLFSEELIHVAGDDDTQQRQGVIEIKPGHSDYTAIMNTMAGTNQTEIRFGGDVNVFEIMNSISGWLAFAYINVTIVYDESINPGTEAYQSIDSSFGFYDRYIDNVYLSLNYSGDAISGASNYYPYIRFASSAGDYSERFRLKTIAESDLIDLSTAYSNKLLTFEDADDVKTWFNNRLAQVPAHAGVFNLSIGIYCLSSEIKIESDKSYYFDDVNFTMKSKIDFSPGHAAISFSANGGVISMQLTGGIGYAYGISSCDIDGVSTPGTAINCLYSINTPSSYYALTGTVCGELNLSRDANIDYYFDITNTGGTINNLVDWYMHFEPVTIDENYLTDYQFEIFTPLDWNQTTPTAGIAICENTIWNSGVPSPYQYEGPYQYGGNQLYYIATKSFCGVSKMNMAVNEYYINFKFQAPNYLAGDSALEVAYDGGSTAETLYYPTNATDINVTINRPYWAPWITSSLNVSIFRQENDLNQEVEEKWHDSGWMSLTNHPTDDHQTYDFTINSSAVGEYIVAASWNNSQSGFISEVGFNTEVIQVWRNTSIDTTNDLIITNQEVLEGSIVNFTVRWRDLEDRNGDAQKTDNVTQASNYLRIFSDQQGNLSSQGFTWLNDLGKPYNGSNPEVITTNLTGIVSITEISNGNYLIKINTSKIYMCKYTGPGNRTLLFKFQKPYHETVTFLQWIFITSDTYFDWLTIAASWPQDPVYGIGPSIIEGDYQYITFRIEDRSRRAYEEYYWDTENYDSIYLTNNTEISENRVHITVQQLNSSILWTPGTTTSEYAGYLRYRLKIDSGCPTTSSLEFYHMNFSFYIDEISGINGHRWQSGHLVNTSQYDLNARNWQNGKPTTMSGILKFQVKESDFVINTMLTFNETINDLNSSGKLWNKILYDWDVDNIYWNETGFYMPDNSDPDNEPYVSDTISGGNFTWNDGIMKFNLTFANDTISGLEPQYPMCNGSRYIDNATLTSKHYANVSYYYDIVNYDDLSIDWEGLNNPLSLRQITSDQPGVNASATYEVTLNVSSVPKIRLTGSTYEIEITMVCTIDMNPYFWEDGSFVMKLEILPMDSEITPLSGSVFPADPFWGDNISLAVVYKDVKNNFNISSATVYYRVFYYSGGTEITVTQGTMSEISVGVYNITNTLDTDDVSEFNLPTNPPTSKTFYISYNATKRMIINGYTSESQVEAYSEGKISFNLQPRPIKILPPNSTKSDFTGWGQLVSIVAYDTFYFTLSCQEILPRPLDPGIDWNASIENVNVSWNVQGSSEVHSALTNSSGMVSFGIEVSFLKGWSYSGATRERIIEIRVSKDNYAIENYITDPIRTFIVRMIKIPIELRLVDPNGETWSSTLGMSVSCSQSQELTFKIDLLDIAYADFFNYTKGFRSKITEAATVAYKVIRGNTEMLSNIMSPERDDYGNRTGRYVGSADPWTLESFWTPWEPVLYSIVFEVSIGTEYDEIAYSDSTFHILFLLESDGFMQVYSMPFLWALIGATVCASVYMSYHGIRILRVPYILRMIENTDKKINRNRKTHAGVMKSREQQIVELAEIELKMFGIKMEPLSAKKLPPPISKKLKKEEDFKLPALTDEQIKQELEKIKDISIEERQLFTKEIKGLSPKDQREFLIGLGASPDLLKEQKGIDKKKPKQELSDDKK